MNGIKRTYFEGSDAAKDYSRKPDVVFTKDRVAVFIDEDSWHGYRFSTWEHKVSDFWKTKISKNRERGTKNHQQLRDMGWTGKGMLEKSMFFRFPMIFRCGLFFPIESLPVFLKPLSYALPLTYGADVLHGAVHGGHILPFSLDLAILAAFCVFLFAASLWNIQRRWIM